MSFSLYVSNLYIISTILKTAVGEFIFSVKKLLTQYSISDGFLVVAVLTKNTMSLWPLFGKGSIWKENFFRFRFKEDLFQSKIGFTLKKYSFTQGWTCTYLCISIKLWNTKNTIIIMLWIHQTASDLCFFIISWYPITVCN